MTPTALLLTLLFGGLVGLASGILGIGGGVLIVPFLYFLFADPAWSGIGLDPDVQGVVAHATSLFVILPTALSGLYTYQRARLVVWRVVVPLGLAALVAAIVGARVAIGLPTAVLQLLFGLLLLMLAGRLLLGSAAGPRVEGSEPGFRLRPVVALASGGAIGFLAAFMGVGGGIIAIPILIYAVRLDLHRVAAASIGIIVFAAAAGVLAYTVAGWSDPGLSSGTAGYVHWPSGLAMLPGAVLCAGWGARLNQRLNVFLLRRLFAIFILLLGIRLIWVNLHVL